MDPRPTKAEVEFEGDCFGTLYNKKAPECTVCLVSKQCRWKTRGFDEVKDKKEITMAVKEKELLAKKKEEKVVKLSSAYKNDHENAGFRPGSAGWAIYQVLREALHKPKHFTDEELRNKAKVFMKEEKIKCDVDSKVPVMVGIFRKMGLIVKIGKGEYKRTF